MQTVLSNFNPAPLPNANFASNETEIWQFIVLNSQPWSFSPWYPCKYVSIKYILSDKQPMNELRSNQPGSLMYHRRRRRIKTDEKVKVVAFVWGKEVLLNSLPR